MKGTLQFFVFTIIAGIKGLFERRGEHSDVRQNPDDDQENGDGEDGISDPPIHGHEGNQVKDHARHKQVDQESQHGRS